MSTTRPESVHIQLSAQRRDEFDNMCRDEAGVLDSGGLNSQQSSMARSKGVKFNAFTSLTLAFCWLVRRLSSLQIRQRKSPYAAKYAEGYAKIRYDKLEQYPRGWARTAAFLVSSENFINVRAFNYIHARLLLKLQNELQHLESDLKRLDNADNDTITGESSQRLRGCNHEQNIAWAQDEVLDNCQSKLVVYDDLCIKLSAMRALGWTPERDYNSMFNWIWSKKPVLSGEYDWVFHAEDFISLTPSKSNWFEEFIWQKSTSTFGKFLKSLIQGDREKQKTDNQATNYFNSEKLGSLSKTVTVFSAVLVLYIPVILFIMTPMTRNSMAGVVLASIFVFSAIMSVQKRCEVHDLFIGTATYCAVLVTFLGNLIDNRDGQT